MITNQCLIALGANVGQTETSVRNAIRQIGVQPGITVLNASSIHATNPIGGPEGQDMFSNAAISAETDLTAREMLEFLLKTEIEFGRHRDIRWQARRLDLDLLLFEEQIISDDDFIVPHPRMSFRRFVLEPATEVAPNMRHPIAHATIAELLKSINRTENLIGFRSENIETAKKFAVEVCARMGCEVMSQKNLEKNRSESPQIDTQAPYTICYDFSKNEFFEPKLTVALINCEKKSPDRFQEHARHGLLAELGGPYLVLDINDVESGQVELTAAIEAMD